jgi:protein arginine kinase
LIPDALMERIRQAPEEGLVLACRVRLARNLEGRSFWDTDTLAGQDQTYFALEAFRSQHFPDLELIADSSCRQDALALLVERLELPQPLKLRSGASWASYQEDSGARGMLLNDEDHLRVWAQRTGCDLLGCLEDLSDWEETLRDHLSLSRDVRWGWKTWSPSSLGSGMQAAVLLFLPALRWTRRLETTRNGLEAMGFLLQPVLESDSDTALLAVANRMSLGLTESELAARLEELVERIVSEERRALDDLTQQQELELRDGVARAEALLGSSRLLSRSEMLRRLELCTMGSRLGWLPANRARLAVLLHLVTGTAHLEGLAGAVSREALPSQDDLRAGAVAKAWLARE